MSTIKRPSLGQIAHLGDFYDARTDSFSSLSLLQGSPPPEAVGRTDNPRTTVDIIKEDTYEGKFRHLGVEAELGASILSGLISVGGIGHFLMETRSSARTRQISCLYKTMTVHERLHIGAFMQPNLKALLNLEALRGNPGTHIVSEIEWGASCAMTVRCDVEGTSDGTEIQTKLGVGLDELSKLVGVGARAAGDIRVGWGAMSQQKTFAIKVCGDFAADKDMPTDFESALEYIKSMPSSIAAYNDGKGKPLVYTLFPIQMLTMMFWDLEIGYHVVLKRLNLEVLEQFVQLFDELACTRQTLEDYQVDVQRHASYLPTEHLREASDSLRQAKVLEAQLKEAYGEALTSVRCGSSGPTCLLALLAKSRSREHSPQNLLSVVQKYRERIKFADAIVAKGGLFIGRDMQKALDNLITTNGRNDTYVLYFSEAAQSQTELWNDSRRLVMELLESREADDLVVVCDCDLGGARIDASYVEQYRGGRLIAKDLGAARRLLEGRCVIRYQPGALDPSEFHPPVQRRKVKLRCPGPRCPTTKHIWICETCRQSVEFGFVDTFLYCRCGRFPYDSCRFRCKQHEQEGALTKPSPSLLLERLQHLQPLTVQEVNVLVLGETGVGKSTWINAFVNYLTHDTLESAMAADKPEYVVPYSFSYQVRDEDGSFRQHDIQAGSSPHEKNSSAGESATQRTIVYRIPLGDEMVLRLIDTPGIGDTRGIGYDIQNQEDILATLHYIERLHGILILLRPANARLNIMFRFCITELMSHLHRDAVNNICFGFTNTRGSNYSPGDTYNPLRKLLSEYKGATVSLSHHNTYCFDSESFRYLAALSETKIPLPGLPDSARSWESSVKESKRLLEHWTTLPGHRVKSTLSLNRARDVLLAIQEPLTQVTLAAEETIKRNVEKAEVLRRSRPVNRAELESELYCIETVVVESVPLPRPMMVCSDKACQGRWEAKDDVDYSEHRGACHIGCHVLPPGGDKYTRSLLLACRVFDRGFRRTCKQCTHHWTMHLRIDSVSRPKTVREGPSEAERLANLRNPASVAELIRATLLQLERYIERREADQQLLAEASIQFRQYLGANSIVTYNHERMLYLDAKIKQATYEANVVREEDTGRGGVFRTNPKTSSLEEQRKVFEKEGAFLGNIIPINQDKAAEVIPTEEMIESTLLKLFAMEHWGAFLRESASRSEPKEYMELPFHAHLHSRSQSSSWEALLARTAPLESGDVESSWRSALVTIEAQVNRHGHGPAESGNHLNRLDSNGEFPLYRAAAGGSYKDTKSLLKQGADPSLRTPFGWSALHWAASNGHKDVVELLLSHGAEVNVKSDTGKTPLSMARKPAIRAMLRNYGARG
ncbi:hypothetical protein B0H67DRAFT_657907 [Lasiosphaeris hirsuta]|uniref:G domain-containing protein n=1 Tax=Lasiosphaeris hirsuta TaxID=260670 RepID=A0AA40E4R4_9PEZI|nr:hypothetical protein B0H67DRAFT_657907 [Lasiosphaeris hirsuta]